MGGGGGGEKERGDQEERRREGERLGGQVNESTTLPLGSPRQTLVSESFGRDSINDEHLWASQIGPRGQKSSSLQMASLWEFQ